MAESIDKHAYISNEIERRLRDSLDGQRWWSFSTHGSTIIIVTFSAVAAVLSQLKMSSAIPFAADLATILSLLVTIVSTVHSKLGFDRKWVANRMTRSALEQLQIDAKMGTDPCVLAKTLKEIIARHDQAITST